MNWNGESITLDGTGKVDEFIMKLIDREDLKKFVA